MSRPLGLKEHYSVSMNETMPLNVVFVFDLSIRVPQKQLEVNTLHWLRKFQTLNTFIQNQELITPSEPLPLVVKNYGSWDETAFADVIQQESHTSLNLKQGPMVRLGFFSKDNGTQLIFTFSHIVVDARAGLMLAADFIHHLIHGEQTPSLLPAAFYPLAPPLETLMPPKAKDSPVQSAGTEAPQIQTDPLDLKAYPVTELRTERLEAYLDPALLAKILAQAKAENLSFTSLLSAAALKAWYHVISEHEQRKAAIHIHFSTMVDLRRYFKDQTYPIGNFVMPLSFPVLMTPTTDLIPLAQKIKQEQTNLNLQKNLRSAALAQPQLGITSVGAIDALFSSTATVVTEIRGYNAIHGFFNTPYSVSVASMMYRERNWLLLSYPAPIVTMRVAQQFYQKIGEVL